MVSAAKAATAGIAGLPTSKRVTLVTTYSCEQQQLLLVTQHILFACVQHDTTERAFRAILSPSHSRQL